jgi:preprotein translocase subunit SecG
MRDAKGQNIVEYVMLVAAVIVVCVIFLQPRAGGPMHDSVNAVLSGMVNQIDSGTSMIQFNSN